MNQSITSFKEPFSVPDYYSGVLVVSDVHLGAFTQEENDRVESAVLSLFQYATDQNWFVIINGDLFDYWMEYPDGTYPKEFDRVLTELQSLADRQEKVPFICGNHDNWTYSLLSNLGLSVEKEYLEVTFKNHTFLITHGDGLEDTHLKLPRKWMNRTLRNPLFLSFYRKIFPSQQGIGLMRWFSSSCRSVSTHEDSTEQIRLNSWGHEMLQEHDFTSVVTGHDHVPRLISHTEGVLLNTGDFFRRYTFGLFLEDVIQLRTWDHTQQTTELLRSERIHLLHE